ncbi:hypothetical protein OA413_04095 [Pelagibacteraceae bacterium]|nr:hypothetical protein [Pelagibacteraceae bacterium]
MLKLIGGAIIVWGFADLGLSWAGIDLWYTIGIDVGELYPYTHWIAFAVGGLLSFMGGSKEQTD